jgi:hypothetical protein
MLTLSWWLCSERASILIQLTDNLNLTPSFFVRNDSGSPIPTGDTQTLQESRHQTSMRIARESEGGLLDRGDFANARLLHIPFP